MYIYKYTYVHVRVCVIFRYIIYLCISLELLFPLFDPFIYLNPGPLRGYLAHDNGKLS